MEWKLNDDRPIWMQLTEQLKRRIVAGQYPPGSRLPSVRELAADAGVNPNTMQRALSQLESDALAVANRTAGRTVTEDTNTIEAIRRQMAREVTREFLTIVHSLGYTTADVIVFLEEEGKK